MSNFYDDDIAAAQEMIEEFGQSVTWRTIRDGALPNTLEPWKPGPPKRTNEIVSIVFLEDTKENRKSFQYSPGTNVPSGNEIGLMASVDFEPKIKDVVLRGTEEMVVKSMSILRPNGTPILYTLEFAT